MFIEKITFILASFMNTSPENLNNNTTEVAPDTKIVSSTPEAVEYVEKFKHIQEDLKNLFNIEVTSHASLSYPWVKDELYTKVIEDLTLGKPFALDYMFEEGLLTKEDLHKRGIEKMKPQVIEILTKIKGPIGRRMKDLIINAEILTEEEADRVSAAS